MSQPVVLCGLSEKIGSGVIELLKSEYEVVHFIMSTEAGKAQIPAILNGEQSVPSNSDLGSKNYSTPPICVILGGGYDADATAEMMEAAKDAKAVAWLRPDMDKPAPPLGPEYGKALVARIKELVPELQSDGRINGAKVFFY
jgi:hypothetical protein